eukprot:GGOE01045806.1.p3 GENE.GGOE01045806.1~~GGOE01045806.1.p3  ORF type:complete len:120 (-),score=1.31 GGOE01045806.1:81-440(-)
MPTSPYKDAAEQPHEPGYLPLRPTQPKGTAITCHLPRARRDFQLGSPDGGAPNPASSVSPPPAPCPPPVNAAFLLPTQVRMPPSPASVAVEGLLAYPPPAHFLNGLHVPSFPCSVMHSP